jgi:hypothetical protein
MAWRMLSSLDWNIFSSSTISWLYIKKKIQWNDPATNQLAERNLWSFIDFFDYYSFFFRADIWFASGISPKDKRAAERWPSLRLWRNEKARFLFQAWNNFKKISKILFKNNILEASFKHTINLRLLMNLKKITSR